MSQHNDRPLKFYWANTDSFQIHVLSTPIRKAPWSFQSYNKNSCWVSWAEDHWGFSPLLSLPPSAGQTTPGGCYTVLVHKRMCTLSFGCVKELEWSVSGFYKVLISPYPPKEVNPGGMMEEKHHKKTPKKPQVGAKLGWCVVGRGWVSGSRQWRCWCGVRIK